MAYAVPTSSFYCADFCVCYASPALTASLKADALRMRREGAFIFFQSHVMFDPMSELTGSSGMSDHGSAPAPSQHRAHHDGGDNRNFASDIHSVTIHARQRTFYIDLKQSGNGKFFKISEKSRGGQKTTIMFDSEDLDKFIQAFEEMKSKV
jgi:hypothetical protein